MVFEYSGGGYAQPPGAGLAIPDSENINMPVQGTAFTAKRGVAFHDPLARAALSVVMFSGFQIRKPTLSLGRYPPCPLSEWMG